MLHLIMDVRRQSPIKQERPVVPTNTQEASDSYAVIVEKIFREPAIYVDPGQLNVDELAESLRQIDARRARYRQHAP